MASPEAHPSTWVTRQMFLNHQETWGAWVAQSVKHLTLALVMISRFVSSNPLIGLCADRSEPGVCFRFCVSLSPSAGLHSVSLSLSQK